MDRQTQGLTPLNVRARGRVGMLFVAGLLLSLTACGGSKDGGGKDKDKAADGIVSKDKAKGEVRWENRFSDKATDTVKGFVKDTLKEKATDRVTDKVVDKAADRPAERPLADEKPNTEDYQHRVDNSFHNAATVPLSTLSIDVDTAAYSNVRRFIMNGQLPPKDAVRVEEMINYFTYRYAEPKGNAPVSLTTDLASCPWNDKHLLVRVALKGRVHDITTMPARNFVFLVDTSGSMNEENKLPLLKKSMQLMIEKLRPQDRVAIVAYAGSAGLVLGSTPGNETNRITNALGRLHAGGSTNGGDGIQLAYKVAQENLIEGGVNRVILGTDGDFNVGLHGGDLVRLVEERRKTGVYLTILGFGMGNLKDGIMEKLAHHGNGHYAYIDTLDEARKLFVEQGAALATIAKDVKLQVEFNPARVGAYRLIGYENRLLKDQDFNDDSKDAGDMGSGHTVTALYEVVPTGQPINLPGVDPLKYQVKGAPPEAAKGGEWLTVKMRYKHPEKETSELVSRAFGGEAEAMAEDFRFAAGVAAFSTLR